METGGDDDVPDMPSLPEAERDGNGNEAAGEDKDETTPEATPEQHELVKLALEGAVAPFQQHLVKTSSLTRKETHDIDVKISICVRGPWDEPDGSTNYPLLHWSCAGGSLPIVQYLVRESSRLMQRRAKAVIFSKRACTVRHPSLWLAVRAISTW